MVFQDWGFLELIFYFPDWKNITAFNFLNKIETHGTLCLSHSRPVLANRNFSNWNILLYICTVYISYYNTNIELGEEALEIRKFHHAGEMKLQVRNPKIRRFFLSPYLLDLKQFNNMSHWNLKISFKKRLGWTYLNLMGTGP